MRYYKDYYVSWRCLKVYIKCIGFYDYVGTFLKEKKKEKIIDDWNRNLIKQCQYSVNNDLYKITWE